MKRFALVLVLLLAVGAVQLFAQDVFGSLPTGSWNDTNYNGTWTIAATGISIRCNATGTVTNFTTSNVQELSASRSGGAVGVTFRSQTHGKTYSFFPNVADGSMRLIIDRPNEEQYVVTMRRAQ